MKNDTPPRRYAGRWFGTGYMMKPDSLFRRSAGDLSGVLLWLAVLPLAALGQANYATPYTFITLAGRVGTVGSTDGAGSTARFNQPDGMALDSLGTLYVADWGDNTIRKVTPFGTNWVVTTLAGLGGADASGNPLHPGSTDGTNSAARFYAPCGLAVDTNGNVYVADNYNGTIRKVTPVGTNWVVTTLAGLAGHPGSADGTNSAARLTNPWGTAIDSAGSLYVTDNANHTVRKVTPLGTNWVVTTLAGLAGSADSADGTGSAARFNNPDGVAVDGSGKLYLADTFNYTIRKGLPASSVPAPILQPPSLSAGQFGFGITGLPGLAVNIESSGNFSQWQAVGGIYILNGGSNYFVNSSPTQGAQFYRAQVR